MVPRAFSLNFLALFETPSPRFASESVKDLAVIVTFIPGEPRSKTVFFRSTISVRLEAHTTYAPSPIKKSAVTANMYHGIRERRGGSVYIAPSSRVRGFKNSFSTRRTGTGACGGNVRGRSSSGRGGNGCGRAPTPLRGRISETMRRLSPRVGCNPFF